MDGAADLILIYSSRPTGGASIPVNMELCRNRFIIIIVWYQ